MFSHRTLPDDVEAVRDAHAPDSATLDTTEDFETLPPATAEDLGLFVDRLRPATYPEDWLPADAPEILTGYVGEAFTVGMPGQGTVIWTDQTDPETVVVKRRAETTPDHFLAFLIAEAYVEIGVDAPGDVSTGAVAGANAMPEGTSGIPEHFLPFFGPTYRDLDAAIRDPDDPTGLGPTDVYQVANALFDAWTGLITRETYQEWEGEHDRLHEAWVDAGDRLEGRLAELPGRVARGETDFGNATEYACSAVRHDLDLPAPFAALDTAAYREHGAAYAVKWAEKTFDALTESS